MLEIQHMLATAMAAFVASNQAASVPNLDMQRMHPRFHPRAWFRISHSWVTEDERKPPAFEGRIADFDWMGWRVEEAVDLPPGQAR